MYWLRPHLARRYSDLPYWLWSSGMGAVSTTQPHTTLYDSPSSSLYANYFNQFNQDVINSYYSGDDSQLWKKMRLANLALQNVTDENAFRLAGKWEDTLDRMGLSPTVVPDFLPPPPPY